ncbi:MAG: putative lipid II flippase FtsW [Calditrichia bacterium]|nr:putative lipid II flippase FtsW [Calditrichia bacterium]
MKISRRKNDGLLVAAVTVLLTIGLIMVFSASAVVAEEKYGSLLYFSRKQILWGFLCILTIFIFSRVKYTNYTKKGLPLLGILASFVLLVGLFLWGDVVNGARRWYSLGFASFQPSELSKIALIVYFADIFSRKGEIIRNWKKGLLPHVIILCMIIIPILFQPDLGTVVMISMIISIMAFLSNIRFKHVLAGITFLVPAAFLKILSSEYQILRINSWLDNLSNPLGSGYQIKQSLIGLGKGGILGSGVGTSKQKFFFLPDSHTDFVFSILGEEIGFIGTSVVLILFMIILWRGISISKYAPSTFAQFLAVGLTMHLVLYGFINVAVVTMLLPTTGLPMPFISYGGSSLISVGLSVGILINISRNSYQPGLDIKLEQFKEDRQSFYNNLVGTQ